MHHVRWNSNGDTTNASSRISGMPSKDDAQSPTKNAKDFPKAPSPMKEAASPELPATAKSIKIVKRDLMLVQQALKENEGGTDNVRTDVAALAARLKELEAQLRQLKTIYMQVGGDVNGLRTILDRQAAEFKEDLAAQGKLISGTSNQVQQHDRRLDLVHAAAFSTPALQQLQQQMTSIEGILQQLSRKRAHSASPEGSSPAPTRSPSPEAVAVAAAAPSSSSDKDLEIQRLQQELAASKAQQFKKSKHANPAGGSKGAAPGPSNPRPPQQRAPPGSKEESRRQMLALERKAREAKQNYEAHEEK